MPSIHTLNDVLAGGHSLIAICRDARCRYQRPVEVERIIGRVGKWEALIPSRGQPHFSDRMRCPSCQRMGMFLWIDPHIPQPPRASEPNYRILDWGRHHPHSSFTMIATADNLMVAHGAYAAAAMFYPDNLITLQQGAFVVADSKRDGPPKPMTNEDFRRLRDAEDSLG